MNYANASSKNRPWFRHVFTTILVSPQMLLETSFGFEFSVAVDIETCESSMMQSRFPACCHYPGRRCAVTFLRNGSGAAKQIKVTTKMKFMR
jgi:hypothetical protein